MTPAQEPSAPDWVADVRAFHEKFRLPLGDSPSLPGLGTQDHRVRLVLEEISELWGAHRHKDLAEIADAIVDSIYVLIGMALTYGIDLRPLWNAVHAANMRKDGGAHREDGKLLKPEGWQPPDIAALLEAQRGGRPSVPICNQCKLPTSSGSLYSRGVCFFCLSIEYAFRQIARKIERGDLAGWWDTCALSTARDLGNRLVQLGTWERHPDGSGRRQFYRPRENAEC